MDNLASHVSQRAQDIRMHEGGLEAGRFEHLDREFQDRVHTLRTEENALKSRWGRGALWGGGAGEEQEATVSKCPGVSSVGHSTPFVYCQCVFVWEGGCGWPGMCRLGVQCVWGCGGVMV